ncbi:MAG: HypC/HybG/HupF family hydrogenase formation chaperone [Chloroflexota bacterium]
MCLAIPVQIKTVGSDGTATVELSGVERQISLMLTPEARVGDYVLLHTGYAIGVLDPAEAQASLRLLSELAAG